MDILWEEKAANQKKAVAFVKSASEKGADLILFPEMSLTGFSMNITLTAEKEMETVSFFKSLAARHEIHIGFGWVEAYQGKARNHYTVVSPREGILSDYVKIHPFSYSGEDNYFVAGNTVHTFTISDFRISTFICYDLRFPEIFQAVSGQADLIVVAANWPAARKEHWRILLQARAVENQTYIAGVNCVGDKGGLSYSGNTSLVDPEGRVVQELSDNEGIVFCDIEKAKAENYRKSFPLKNDRKIDLYKTIL